MIPERPARTGSLDGVLELLRQRFGLVFTAGRRADVEGLVLATMARSRAARPAPDKAQPAPDKARPAPPPSDADVVAYLRLLREDAAALDDLLGAVTVGETYFFRAAEQLNVLREEVIPEILERAGREHPIRVWSAGCASGEEAYSLAILLEEMGLGEQAEILATDVSRQALAKAAAGVYGPWSLRGADPAMVKRCFHAAGSRKALDERLRKKVTFRWLNLAGDAYPTAAGPVRVDILVCCNVLMYLSAEALRGVANRLFETLAPGGWLFTGASDPPLSADGRLVVVETAAGIVYRRPVQAWGEASSGVAAGAAGSARQPVSSGREARRRTDPSGQRRARGAEPGAKEAGGDGDLRAAREALAAGNYTLAIELTDRDAGAEAAALGVRARANRDGAASALAWTRGAVRRLPLSAELRFLEALLLREAGRDEDAVLEARRAIYLDGGLFSAHFFLGEMLARRGDRDGARRAFEAAAELAGRLAPETPVALADGERAGKLALAARMQAARLGGAAP